MLSRREVLERLGYAEAQQLGSRFYADAYLFVSGGEETVVKVVTGHKSLGGFASLEQAQDLARQIVTYRNLLEAAGIPVAPFTTKGVTALDVDGQPCVLIASPFLGTTIESLLRSASADAGEALFANMIMSVIPLLARGKGKPSDVGIDGVASNFVVDRDSVMWYVDVTPARYYCEQAGYLVEFPQPTDPHEVQEGVNRYFTAEGIVSRMLTDCCRVRPDLRARYVKQLRLCLEEPLWQRICEAIPTLRLVPDSSISDILALCRTAASTAVLRDAACHVASCDGCQPDVTSSWIEQFFTKSRHHLGGTEVAAEELIVSIRDFYHSVISAH